MTNLEEAFVISGVVSGPDGEPLEGILIWAWQGERSNSGHGRTGMDGVFEIKVPSGSFRLDIYVGEECDRVGWYDGSGGLTTQRSQVFRVIVDDANVTGIEIKLSAKFDYLSRVESCP